MKKYKLDITFTTEMLGTVPRSKAMYEEFLVKRALEKAGALPPVAVLKAISEEELETVKEAAEAEGAGWTQFREYDGGLVLVDYMLRGFFKAAMGALRPLSDAGKLGKIKAYKKAVDQWLFVTPRFPKLMRNGVTLIKPDVVVERPIRVETMRGPRVALAISDAVLAGTTCSIELLVLHPEVLDEEMIRQILDYGALSGIGQFRNGSYGRFTYTLECI